MVLAEFFGSRPNRGKDLIRQVVDTPIISNFAQTMGRDKLSYFGCPGPRALDIREWKSHIRRVVAVDENEAALRNCERVIQAYIPDINLFTIHGDIEDVILNHDGFNRGKILSEIWDNEAQVWRWQYDIVNLDVYQLFLSSIRDVPGSSIGASYFKRYEALNRVFTLQKGNSFVFMLTVPERGIVGDAKSHLFQYLKDVKNTCPEDYRQSIDWSLNQATVNNSERYALVRAIPTMIAYMAASQSTEITSPRMFRYTGETLENGRPGARMMHFICVCEATNISLPTRIDWEVALNTPTLRVSQRGSNLEIVKDDSMNPTFDDSTLEDILTNYNSLIL